jgi:hypothetical protein
MKDLQREPGQTFLVAHVRIVRPRKDPVTKLTAVQGQLSAQNRHTLAACLIVSAQKGQTFVGPPSVPSGRYWGLLLLDEFLP